MVSENRMGMPAIVGDATGGKVRKRWLVPIGINSDLLLFTTKISTYLASTEIKYMGQK